MSLFTRLNLFTLPLLFAFNGLVYALSGTIFGGSYPLANAIVNLLDTDISSQIGLTAKNVRDISQDIQIHTNELERLLVSAE